MATESKSNDNITKINPIKDKNIHTVWILIKGYTSKPKIKLNNENRRNNWSHVPGFKGGGGGDQNTDYLKHQDAPYLPKLDKDMERMTAKIAATDNHHCYMIIDIAHNTNYSKDQLQNSIEDACKKAKESVAKRFMIYYTGHGQMHTGNWIINPSAEQNISLQDIFTLTESYFDNPIGVQVHMVNDCCFSADWIKKMQNYTGNKEFKKERKNSMYVFAPKKEVTWAKDGKFSPWFCQETEDGVCLYGKIENGEFISNREKVVSPKSINESSDDIKDDNSNNEKLELMATNDIRDEVWRTEVFNDDIQASESPKFAVSFCDSNGFGADITGDTVKDVAEMLCNVL